MSTDSGESDVLPECIQSEATDIIGNLFPERSKEAYMRTYNDFNKWKSTKGVKSVSESVLLEYKKLINMKAVLILLVVSCALAAVYGDLVCGLNYCKQHPCSAPVAQSSCRSPSVYRPNHAGKCACCPACVSLLGEGQQCKAYSKELGETPSAVCREPLLCLKGVCTKVTPRR